MSDNYKKVPPIFVGKMWSETEGTVLASGNIVRWEDKDLENPPKRYIKVIKSKNNKGETKIEFLQSMGLLYDNTDDPQRRPNSPDIGGGVTVDEIITKGSTNPDGSKNPDLVSWAESKFGAWIKADADYAGDLYSISISKKNVMSTPAPATTTTAFPADADEDFPF